MTGETAQRKPVLEAVSIVKDFPGVRALDGVALELFAGEIHALVGENGAGKSTLIRILTGEHPYGTFQGQVRIRGCPACLRSVRDAQAAGIQAVHQELALVRHLSVGENVLLGDEPRRFGFLDRDRLFQQAEAAMGSLGVAVDVRTATVNLGTGEQQLVEIAKALRRNSPFLILDEPTAALATHEVTVLANVLRGLRQRGIAIVYISHRLDEVLALADRITVLRDGRTVATRPVGEWTREAVVQAMVGRQPLPAPVAGAARPGTILLEVADLCVTDPAIPGRRLLDGISLGVRAGEVVGLAGLMGAGRTELLCTLFGAPPGPWRGRVSVAGQPLLLRSPQDAIAAGLALVPEDRKGCGVHLGFSILHNLSMAHLADYCRWGFVSTVRETLAGRRVAAELGIRAASLDAPAGSLSGGNQQKTVLGKWLVHPPRVLLLDEPTRGIDVGAKAEIHALIRRLADQGMGALLVSSELPELLAACDRILVLRRGRLAGTLSREDATAERVMALAT